MKLIVTLLPLLWVPLSAHADDQRPEPPNVLLIGMDTTRADHLGCYGYERDTSPHIDRLAAEGLQFMTCISHIPVTAPSFATIFTSKLPMSNGVLDNNWWLADKHVTLTEVLKAQGYRTAAFVSGLTLKRNIKLDQGFDLYNEDFDSERIAETVNKPAMEWIQKNRDEKFFLFLHYFDPHGRYSPPAPYHEKFEHTREDHDLSKIPKWQRHGKIADPSYYIAQYDGEIAYNDCHIGEVLKQLERLGLLENTLIVYTADHGESMVEHDDWFNHGSSVYEELVHVPLIIRWPARIAPRKIHSTAQLIDIMPTLLDLLGIEPIEGMEGASLLPLIDHDGLADRDIYLESEHGKPGRKENIVEGILGKVLGIRTNDWKMMRTPKTTGVKYELYNLEKDPGELQNLMGGGLEIESQLRAKLDAYARRYEDALPWFLKRADKVEVDEAQMKKLRSIGYF